MFIRYLASSKRRIEWLLQSAKSHIEGTQSGMSGDIFSHISAINPRFTFLLAEEFLEQSPADPKKEGTVADSGNFQHVN